MKLNTKLFDQMFEKITPLLRSGRPGDYLHIKSVYARLVKDYKSGACTYRPRIMLAAALLHDVGFGFVKTRQMFFFTGAKKVGPMRDAIQILTLAYAPVVLTAFGFSSKEIQEICAIIEHSDDDVLTVKHPAAELVLLHDLNLYDRLLPHRLRMASRLYPDPVRLRAILEKSVALIMTPRLREEAQRLLEKLGTYNA